MAAATQTRYDLVIPSKEAFDGKPYIPATGLASVYDVVTEKHGDVLGPLADYPPDLLWRARGGTSRGRPKFADTLKASALLHYYSGREAIVCFSADHLRDLKTQLTPEQWEALMFRELLKIGQQENTGSLVIKAFDVTAFHVEAERYGNWDADLAKLYAVGHPIDQPALFEFGSDDEDEEETSSTATTGEDANEEVSGNVVPFDVDAPRNGRPHSEADIAAEKELKNRGRGAE